MASTGFERSDTAQADRTARSQPRFPLLRYYLITSLLVIAVMTVLVAFLFVRRAEADFAERASERGAIEAGHLVQLFYRDVYRPAQQANPPPHP